jgi:hydrogenase maturation factor HypE
MLRRPGGRIYRPDWRDTIVDLAKVNLLRKLDAMNVDPLHFQTDAIWVATDADVPQKLFPDRGNIGALRFEELMTMDEYRNGNEA